MQTQHTFRRHFRSSNQHAFRIGISDRSVIRIQHKDLNFQPYKLQIVQCLNSGDYKQRVEFCENMLTMFQGNDAQVNNMWMSDEAHFHLSGFDNKQNFRYWAAENPCLLHERPLHAQKVTVWCMISASGIICPFFFEDEAGNTVNSQRYDEMIHNFLSPQLTGLQ